MMRVWYIGPDIGVDGLFDGHVYDVLGIHEDFGMLRIIDESGEDYLYSPTRPKPAACPYEGGRFEIVEDNESRDLYHAIYG